MRMPALIPSLVLLVAVGSASGAEAEQPLSPDRLYVVAVKRQAGTDLAKRRTVDDCFVDTHPMDTIHLPDEHLSEEKRTITMIGPRIAQIVESIESACASDGIVIVGAQAGKLTRESAETVIAKMQEKD